MFATDYEKLPVLSVLILIQTQTGNLIRPVTFFPGRFIQIPSGFRTGGGSGKFFTRAFTEAKNNRIC